MRYIVFVMIAVVALIAIRLTKKNRGLIFLSAVFLMTAICGLFSFSNADKILASVQHTEQTLFSPEFLETGEFPDAFLRLLFKEKKVYIKDDLVDFLVDTPYAYQYAAFHGRNPINYLESVDAKIVMDASMNDKYVLAPNTDDFENIGYLNDFMRNTVLYTKYDREWANYFAYVWYYRDFAKPSHIYVNADGLEDTDEIVVIWQRVEGEEEQTEDLFIMSKDYYETVIVK